MKFCVTFKTPNVLDDAMQEVYDAARCSKPECTGCVDCDRTNEAAEETVDEMMDCVERFVKYDEYVTIEFDTESSTARVLPVRK